MRALVVGLAVAAVAAAPIAGPAHAGGLYELLRLDRSVVKWGQPETGTGAHVSYALVRETTKFAGARNCQEMQSPDALLAGSSLNASAFMQELEAAFAMWTEAANISFYRVDDPKQAQILVGAQTVDRGTAFANVQYQIAGADAVTIGKGEVRTIRQSLVCLNPARSWKIGFSGTSESYDVRYTLAHEIGHAIGLDHPGASGQLMAFTYQEKFRALQPGDIAGAVALYGSRPVVAESERKKLAYAPAAPAAVHN